MIHRDTVELLKECNAGIKMGVDSITDVYGKAKSEELRDRLLKCRDDHQKLGSETHDLLNKYHDRTRSPGAVARKMAHMKTEMSLMLNQSDSTIAGIITDGCNMGIKSLNRYLNKYTEAEEKAKDIAKKLIKQEEQLAADIRQYL